mgnify:FL=1
MAELTSKQEMFCNEYLVDFNASRAARAAGYSEDTAGAIGHENLRKPEIQARIQQLREITGKQFNITRERIAQEYSRLAFLDIRKAHDENGELIAIKDLDDDTAAGICGIEVSEMKIGENSIGQLKKIKLADKRAALDSLVKLMGYAAPTKTELDGADCTPLGILNIDPLKGEE